MLRTFSALSILAFAAAPVAASSYSAKPVVPVSQRIIARDIVWNCGPDACQGSTEDSRPAVLCEGLVKKAGRVDSFLVDGRAFTSEQLDRCNAAAKSLPAKALASQ